MTGANPIARHNGRSEQTDKRAANGKRSWHRPTTHRHYSWGAIGGGNVKVVTLSGLNVSHTHTTGALEHSLVCRRRRRTSNQSNWIKSETHALL